RQRTRSPSSNNTLRRLTPLAPSDRDKFIWRTPRSRQWRKLGLQGLLAPLACFADQLPPRRSPPRGRSGRESVWRQRNDEHERKRGAAASCWHYLAPLAIFSVRHRELCEVRQGCSSLSEARRAQLYDVTAMKSS